MQNLPSTNPGQAAVNRRSAAPLQCHSAWSWACAALVGLAACGQPTVSDRIGEQARNSGMVDMARAAEFAWTQVRIYTPYSARHAVCKDLGELAPDCLQESPASVAEGEFLLAFINEGKGARYESHRRSNGHFLYHTGVLALQRHEAVLDVVPYRSARQGSAFYLKPRPPGPR
ncbi:hypothetical protein [Acidovorax kalamii]|uniref:hypothetical protein n=1 Tax=Acidovorax kalamii TaxID=2004485 RepID=UPI000B942FFE|nr:hypothetical protein [Acidovorax kalamii]